MRMSKEDLELEKFIKTHSIIPDDMLRILGMAVPKSFQPVIEVTPPKPHSEAAKRLIARYGVEKGEAEINITTKTLSTCGTENVSERFSSTHSDENGKPPSSPGVTTQTLPEKADPIPADVPLEKPGPANVTEVSSCAAKPPSCAIESPPGLLESPLSASEPQSRSPPLARSSSPVARTQVSEPHQNRELSASAVLQAAECTQKSSETSCVSPTIQEPPVQQLERHSSQHLVGADIPMEIDSEQCDGIHEPDDVSMSDTGLQPDMDQQSPTEAPGPLSPQSPPTIPRVPTPPWGYRPSADIRRDARTLDNPVESALTACLAVAEIRLDKVLSSARRGTPPWYPHTRCGAEWLRTFTKRNMAPQDAGTTGSTGTFPDKTSTA
ncbi:uncharacterized protein PHACADRAFT_210421 [Phanerochaete carnosa HHB-10118-sp]|uniref:Uncharacterized protein n=1 Tax=Phanerochaete carnosa (strain HHB-10118-sp) TaxID=650164 RepID=K5WVY1_PHACS|nr:uncharacterized protein PHACADRAFT_210421 [Phanerochaete carnosa HHB-10118-sp]EKM54622.1 hypothetical protein PHACADRAFT_210421 [Phanerochaete carnosa HHB-10118-sp]